MNKTLLKIKDYLPFILVLFFALCLSVNKHFSSFTLDGIKMYFATLFPSLFPYLFITAMLSLLKGKNALSKILSKPFSKIFNLNGACGYAYLMSLISGYPIGAIIVSDLRKKNIISKSESIRASALCSTSSPSFLITIVGSLCFNSVKIGVFLFLSHLLTSIIIGVTFSFYKRKDKPLELTFLEQNGVDNLIYEGVYSTINSALFVGGIVTLFYVFTEILYSLGLLNLPIDLLTLIIKDKQLAKCIVIGLFETTKGIKLLSSLSPSSLTFCTCSFLTGFSGLSIIMQSTCYLKSAKIKTAPFFLSKVLSAVLNLFFSFIFSLLLF